MGPGNPDLRVIAWRSPHGWLQNRNRTQKKSHRAFSIQSKSLSRNKKIRVMLFKSKLSVKILDITAHVDPIR